MKRKLIEIAELIPGFAFKSGDFGDYPNKVVKITQITPPDIDIKNAQGIDITRYNESKLRKFLVGPGDYLMAMTGATIGKIGRIAKGQAYINQRVLLIRPKSEYVNRDFLYYAICHPSFEKYIFNHIDSQSAQPNISAASTGDYEIDLPDLLTQEKIGGLLRSLDTKRAINLEINGCLEAQAELIYDSLIAGADETWRAGTLEDLSSSIVCGKTPSTKDPLNYGTDVPFVTIPDLHGQVFITSTERSLSLKGASSQFNKYLPPFTVVVSCIGTAGLVSMLSEKSQTNQQINSIIPKEGISPFYCYFVAKRKKDEINAVGMSGSTIVNLNKQAFSRLETIIPSQLQMADFDRKVRPLFQAILDNQRQNRLLAFSRELLLPKLMSGEINVDNIEVR